MDFVSYEIHNQQQFWEVYIELTEILFPIEKTQKYVDISIKNFLNFTTIYGVNKYLKKDADYELCCYKFLNSSIFILNKDYVRYQMIKMINQQDMIQYFYILYWLLFLDAQSCPQTYKLMKDKGSFQSLVITVWKHFQKFPEVHRLGLKILYEMSREYQLTYNELFFIHEEFLCFIFELLEKNVYDGSSYVLSIIKLILLINEQYIIRSLPSHLQSTQESSKQIKNDFPVNFVMDILKKKGNLYKTYGEDIIFVLNRQKDTYLQFLILKQLYLLFTTKETFEYFYTNDLKVLVDVFIKKLYNFSEDNKKLYQTYLRVFYYLLKNTQLKNPPHYKQNQLQKLFQTLKETISYQHVKSINEITEKLLERCINISWIKNYELKNDTMFFTNWSNESKTSFIDVVTVNNDHIFPDSNKLHTI
ncbi:uncharacterized protein T551_02329 [Pneumocystis jirovecii RU7]|uniref:SPIN90/Ldb17 leucine-rich domain-containing protein n=1 Tax=Pneumocystis jirovecii (strain RU7) TaxID=1408657 RepID=A0A0W4ZL08_PNEJ7|nr:uncharacterized protein T551_02329 [Pneumocystis jirovecii RU7]KTW29055.1 hypothetical protein T551_02329 [Pneumocystis jirovecii RU7]